MLNWVPLLQGRMGSACDGGIEMTETPTVDPLKKIIVTRFKEPIPGRDAWVGFQVIVHAFASINDCVVQRIRKVNDKQYLIEVLIKNRIRSTSRDPFVDDWKSSAQRKKEEFIKYLRDKSEELKNEAKDVPEPTNVLPPDPNLWNR